MTVTHTKIIAIIGSIFCIVSFAVAVSFLYVIVEKKGSFHERSVERAETKARIESLDALELLLEETKGEREFLLTRVLTDENVIDFLSLIESLGKEQGVELKTNSLTVESVSKDFDSLVIQMTVKGPYRGVMNVLKLFEHLPYQSSVSNVNFQREDESVWTSTYELQVTKFRKI